MKKKINTLLCAVFICILTVLPVLAATSVTVTLKASKTTVNSGDTFTVTVSAKANNCGQGSIELSYNTSVLELVSGECVASGADISYFDSSAKEGGFAYSNSTNLSGNVFKLTFKVKTNAAVGESTIKVNMTADSASASKSINITVACVHKYDNDCDDTCNLCGDKRTVTHKWNSGKVTKEATCTAKGSATYTCKICEKTKTESIAKKSHTYDNACDPDCNVCGYERTITHSYHYACNETGHWEECSVCGVKKEDNTENHTFGDTLSSNATGHGHACTICGYMQDEESHIFENDCDDTCDTCGYKRTVTHDYSTQWTGDETGHWHECVICGDKLEVYPHEPGPEATDTTDQICLTCGYILEVAGNHQHTMAGDWLSDDNGHWFLCNCHEYTDPEPHTWNDGVIDETAGTITYTCLICGHNLVETYTPSETQPDNTEPSATEPNDTKVPTGTGTSNSPLGFEIPWFVAPILAITLIISLCYNIFLLRCLFSSKKTGKFTKQNGNNTPAEPTITVMSQTESVPGEPTVDSHSNTASKKVSQTESMENTPDRTQIVDEI